MRLSIAMMVKNESKYLEQCLKALQPIRNEIESELIIVDTGSTDNTIEIARRYTDKVYFHKWTNNYSEMRNICIGYASGEWVFILDADEIMEDCSDFISFFQGGKADEFGAASVVVKNFMYENNEKMFNIGAIPRLFKKYDGLKYCGIIHEQPKYREPLFDMKTVLLHYGYVQTDKDLMRKKYKRYVPLLEKELRLDPNNLYYWYQLSSSYSMYDENQKAIEAAIKAYEIAKNKGVLRSAAYVYVRLAFAYCARNDYQKIEEICREGIGYFDTVIDLYFLLAKAQTELSKNDEAMLNYSKYLQLVKDKNNYLGRRETAIGVYTIAYKDMAYLDLARIYERKEEYEKVLEYTEKISDKDCIKNAFPLVINAYIKKGKYSAIKEYYQNNALNRDKSTKNTFMNVIEQITQNLYRNEYKEVLIAFTDSDDDYSVLAKVRLKIIDEDWNIDNELLMKVLKIDLNKLPYYFGDVVFYLLKTGQPVTDMLCNVYQHKLENCLNRVHNTWFDFSQCVLAYLRGQRLKYDLDSLRINKALQKSLLISDRLNNEEYAYVFKQYLLVGFEYLHKVYNHEVIENKLVHAVRNDEDMFFLNLMEAENSKSSDISEYIRALRECLDIYPCMARGIKLRQDEIDIHGKHSNQELEESKSNIKSCIQTMIESGNLNDAKNTIIEYEKICNDDIEICSMKAVIAIMENRLDDAEEILEQALMVCRDNFDILYNIAYVKELEGENIHSRIFYTKAMNVCNDDDIRNEIHKVLAV